MAAPRLPLVPADTSDPALDSVFDVFRRRGMDVPDLYRALANAPAMLEAWVGVAWPLRNAAVSDRGLRELIIMRVAQLTGASYEWVAHHEMALQHGIGEDRLAELRDWRTSERFTDDQRTVLAMTDELADVLDVGDATWERLAAQHEPGEIVELVLTAAFYCCVSRVLRAFRLPVDSTDARLAGF